MDVTVFLTNGLTRAKVSENCFSRNRCCRPPVEVSEYIFMLNEGFYNKFTSPSEIDNIVVDNIETLFAGFHTESVVYL